MKKQEIRHFTQLTECREDLEYALDVLKGHVRGINPIDNLSNNESSGHDTVLNVLRLIMKDEMFADYKCHSDWFYAMDEEEQAEFENGYEDFIVECDSYNRNVIDKAIELAEKQLEQFA
jgi:hypothetical protein